MLGATFSSRVATAAFARKTAARPRPLSTAAPPAAGLKGLGLKEGYEVLLEKYPLPTKMASGCLLWGLGDGVAQLAPQLVGAPTLPYDLGRTARACFFGCVIHAPVAHCHYNFLEWLTLRVKPPGSLGPTVFKTVMEQFVYWGWFSNVLYHGSMGLMQGQTPTEVKAHVDDVLWDTMKAQWVFWIPVQLINFRFTPVRHQLNVVLATSVVWTAFLSFAFPTPAAAVPHAAETPM
ncbi:hypothetical protein M885DRAFT_508321 [Pelagophyceae sp. CCMP2097]|nr:hypothetical protein M885DRAFT_508321 [Pelagophyceae sp. CCMP2097]